MEAIEAKDLTAATSTLSPTFYFKKADGQVQTLKTWKAAQAPTVKRGLSTNVSVRIESVQPSGNSCRVVQVFSTRIGTAVTKQTFRDTWSKASQNWFLQSREVVDGNFVLAQPKLTETKPKAVDPAEIANSKMLEGMKFLNQGRNGDAERVLREAARLRGSDSNLFYLAKALHWQGKFSEAETELRKATLLTNHYDGIYSQLGDVLFSQNKYAEAEIAYREGVRRLQGDSEIYFKLGKTLRKQEKYTEAEIAYREAAKRNPVYYNELGHLFFDQGKWTESETAYREAIRSNAKDGVLHANLTGALYKQNRLDEAKACAQKAIQLGCKQHPVYKLLGLNP